MIKSVYLQKLAATVMEGSNTLDEAKTAKKAKKKLGRFWEDAALDYIKKTHGRDLRAEEAGWTYVKFSGVDLATEGDIIVTQWVYSEWDDDWCKEGWVVPKRLLIDPE